MDADLKRYLESMEGRLVEKMRDMQTELQRGFAAFSEGQTFRLRKWKRISRTWMRRYQGA